MDQKLTSSADMTRALGAAAGSAVVATAAESDALGAAAVGSSTAAALVAVLGSATADIMDARRQPEARSVRGSLSGRRRLMRDSRAAKFKPLLFGTIVCDAATRRRDDEALPVGRSLRGAGVAEEPLDLPSGEDDTESLVSFSNSSWRTGALSVWTKRIRKRFSLSL